MRPFGRFAWHDPLDDLASDPTLGGALPGGRVGRPRDLPDRRLVVRSRARSARPRAHRGRTHRACSRRSAGACFPAAAPNRRIAKAPRRALRLSASSAAKRWSAQRSRPSTSPRRRIPFAGVIGGIARSRRRRRAHRSRAVPSVPKPRPCCTARWSACRSAAATVGRICDRQRQTRASRFGDSLDELVATIAATGLGCDRRAARHARASALGVQRTSAR